MPGKNLEFFQSDSLNAFDITEFVKQCFKDQMKTTETNGLVLQNEGVYSIMATSDHSLYAPYIHIQLTNEPLAFLPLENINQ